MSIEDYVRSMDARISRLSTAVEKLADVEIDGAQWSAEALSRMQSFDAGMKRLSEDMRVLAKAVARFTVLLDGRKELKTTASYPIASGAYDEEISTMHAEGATDRDIARELGCHPMTVSRRRCAIGIEGRRRDSRWTPREDAVLK